MVKKQQRSKFSLESLMKNTALALVRDFRSNLNDPCFCSDYLSALQTGNIARIREAVPTVDFEMDVATFKATYQISSLMKRFRYQKDIYSDQELREISIKKFLDTQDRISAVNLDRLPASCQLVLDVAATYVAEVLGPYSDEEHRDLCRFGRRASVGIPSRLACLAERWELPLTGSQEQIAWFDSEMSHIDCVQEYWINQLDSDPNRSNYRACSSLKLTLVPKTFKALRVIMPNTTIGSYMSFGLGEMIRKRLKRAGYDISTLQERHKYLARSASSNELLVTADLSSASDSITDALVKRLFPRDWYNILASSRIANVELPDGRIIESKTFCTMGIGYTFPLQTLVFLSLLKAIQAILYDRFDRRTISVYGDDLIYSSRMHSWVVYYFQRLGFVINLDKTFHDVKFRESCGGDYYHGVDVRPFQPQNGSVSVGPKTYEAVLYKYVNGLLARWSEYEIGNTLDYLTSEITKVTGKCKLVPCDFPDDSGVKCVTPTSYDFLRRTVVASPKHKGSGVFQFVYLRFRSELRKELRHEPYYWDALRGRLLPVNYAGGRVSGEADYVPNRLDIQLGISAITRETFIRKDTQPILTFRGISGRRLRRQNTFITCGDQGRYTRQLGVSCFGTRRPSA